MARRISESLVVEGAEIRCARCAHPLGPAGQGWKSRAALSETPVARLPGAGLGIEQTVVIRHFACPSCCALLDSETAMPGDPFLQDVVLG